MDVSSQGSVGTGVRDALPLVLPTFGLAVTFGLLARSLGWGAPAPVVMSLIVFSGSAQFAAATVLGAGGTAWSAAVAALLVNARFLPLGVAVAPALRGGRLRRALEGQAVVDASVALAQRGAAFDRGVLFGATLPQYVAWQLGTIAGAVGLLDRLDPEALGLDVLFPVFFLGLLLPSLREQRVILTTIAAALLALALIPIAPAGVPVLAASLVSLLGVRHSLSAERRSTAS